jgi:hypothetical protein
MQAASATATSAPSTVDFAGRCTAAADTPTRSSSLLSGLLRAPKIEHRGSSLGRREGRLVRATLMAQGAGSTTGQAPRFLSPRGAWVCWNPSSTDDRLSALDRGEFAASAGGGQPWGFRYLAELS